VDKRIPFRLRLLKKLLPASELPIIPPQIFSKTGISGQTLANYTVSVKFPAVSGFEILEMLQARSHLAQIENNLSTAERLEIESADATFLAHANEFYASLSEIANLGELRAKMNTLPSHWWWHLDKLAQQKREAVAV